MLTGLQQDDIRNLAKTNVLPSHRNRRGHYRFNVDAVEKYFGIVIDNIEQEAEPSALKANPSKESQDVDKVNLNMHYPQATPPCPPQAPPKETPKATPKALELRKRL